VIAFVPDHWSGVWGVRHQVLPRLSRYFNVLWVSPNSGWREAWTGTPEHATGGDAGEYDKNFSVFTHSRWRPELYRPRPLANYLQRQVRRRVLQQARNLGCSRIVLYVWRPEYGGVLDEIEHDLSLYHIDDEYSFSETEVPLSPEESCLMQRVDQVFIHSPGLMEKKGQINRHTQYIPNGVDFQAYATLESEPPDLAGISGPRIAYVGVIKKQLDLEMMRDIALSRPDWSFVLVGPVGNVEGKVHYLEEMENSANVHLLGAKPAAALPAYVQHVDVCTMCYEVNAYTQYIYPLKLHEYLAAGKPVVSSPIKTVREFAEVVDFAGTADEWCAAIERNLSADANSVDRQDVRRSTARAYDWERSVEAIAATITERLAD